jgi:GNAT superfamily N-acetyltransferase
MSLPTEAHAWAREGFLISTDKSLLSPAAINSAFGQDLVYWTNAVPEPILRNIIDNSFCFGLYDTSSSPETPSAKQIGFARLITDNITFAYLTDVYVLPEYQGRGLGGWLIDCVDELLRPLPFLRWTMLRTSNVKSKESYEKRLGMMVLESGDVSQGPVMMGKRGEACRT